MTEFDPTSASTQYSEWKGSVAVDLPDRHELLYDLVGVRRDEWFIIGIDITGGRIGEGDLSAGVAVYAVPADGGLDHDAVVQQGGADVTEFIVADPSAALKLLEDVFKRWSIRATSKGFLEAGVRFNITDEQDLGEE